MITHARDYHPREAWATADQAAFEEKHTTFQRDHAPLQEHATSASDHSSHEAHAPSIAEHEAGRAGLYLPHPPNPLLTPASGAPHSSKGSPEHQTAALLAHTPQSHGDQSRPVTQGVQAPRRAAQPHADATPNNHPAFPHTHPTRPSTSSDDAFGTPVRPDVDQDHQRFPRPDTFGTPGFLDVASDDQRFRHPYALGTPGLLNVGPDDRRFPSPDALGTPGAPSIDPNRQSLPHPDAFSTPGLPGAGPNDQQLPHPDTFHQDDLDPSGDQAWSHSPATAVDSRDTMAIPGSAAAARTPVASPLQRIRDAVVSQGPALDPGKPGLRVLLAVGALAAAVAAFLVWRAQPKPQPLPAPTPVTPASPSPTAQVTVHVAGKIRKPGVYLLPSGARVTDAVTAAGGLTRGASIGALNLARRLIDGEQIVVGAKPAPGAQSPSVVDPANALIDLNTATPEQLEQLPGVGEVLAARIVEYRTSRGGFTSIDQLRDVSGIGASRFEEIKRKVRI